MTFARGLLSKIDIVEKSLIIETDDYNFIAFNKIFSIK